MQHCRTRLKRQSEREEAEKCQREEIEKRKRDSEAMTRMHRHEREARQQKKGPSQGAERKRVQDVVFVNPRKGMCQCYVAVNR